MKIALIAIASLLVPVTAVKQPPIAPPAPQAIALITCRVDNLGLDNLPPNIIPSRLWQNLEWHRDKENKLECKRDVVPLTDATVIQAPEMKELHPDFSDFAQCAAVAMSFGSHFAKPGWAVAAVGCPVKIVNRWTDDQGRKHEDTIGWKMPDCPSWLTCSFNEDAI